MTGFARIIGWKQTENGKKLNFIEEGEYLEGFREGYSRNISAVDGQVELGYYTQDQMTGKACVYDLQDDQYFGFEGIFKEN